MPSTSRRSLLGSSISALATVSGCITRGSSSTPAHWVTVYLGDREDTREVVVRIRTESETVVFEKEYRLSDSNEADENAPFDASTDPETVTVIVDGVRFDRDWPGFEHPALPCDDPNRSGVEIWIESADDGSPEIRMGTDCQHVTVD